MPEELPAAPQAERGAAAHDYLALPPIEGSADWTVTLPIVVDSVQRAYPLLRVASLEGEITDGDWIAARGAFDLNAKAYSLNQPQGFYQNYRHKITLTQPTFHGGYVLGSYRLGDGFFPDWYGERETNEGGEFAMGFGGPLLQNRSIDKRRSELFQAEVARQAVEPNVQAQMLDFVRAASQSYWVWVASGQAVEAWRTLLRLAQQRVTQIDKRVAAGDLERIVRINNEQLIAARETKVIEAERKLQMAAIKLSLFLRTPIGEPIVPAPEQLPDGFPDYQPPDEEQVEADIAVALASRPELVELDLLAEKTRIELAQAENSLLPKVDWVVYASKDMGAAASSKGDKTPFELEAGLTGEVPLQRRQARGKVRALEGKLAQISAKREFTANKITAEVQDAVSALRAASGRIERARRNLSLATETQRLARLQFEAGDIDLVELNIYEQAVTDAQFLLIAAQADFYIAQADLRAALAVDPNLASSRGE